MCVTGGQGQEIDSTTMVHLHCQVDWIWNHLGDTPEVSVLTLNEKKKWESEMSASIHLSLLPDCEHSVARHLLFLAFPDMSDCILSSHTHLPSTSPYTFPSHRSIWEIKLSWSGKNIDSVGDRGSEDMRQEERTALLQSQLGEQNIHFLCFIYKSSTSTVQWEVETKESPETHISSRLECAAVNRAQGKDWYPRLDPDFHKCTMAHEWLHSHT